MKGNYVFAKYVAFEVKESKKEKQMEKQREYNYKARIKQHHRLVKLNSYDCNSFLYFIVLSLIFLIVCIYL